MSRVIGGEGIRRSVIRADAPIISGDSALRTSYLGAPVYTDNTLRGSYVGAPIRRSYVRGDAPLSTRVISGGDNYLRSSYLGAPVSYANAPVYASTIGTPVTYAPTPVGTSYIRTAAPTLRHSTYLG